MGEQVDQITNVAKTICAHFEAKAIAVGVQNGKDQLLGEPLLAVLWILLFNLLPNTRAAAPMASCTAASRAVVTAPSSALISVLGIPMAPRLLFLVQMLVLLSCLSQIRLITLGEKLDPSDDFSVINCAFQVITLLDMVILINEKLMPGRGLLGAFLNLV